MKTNYHTHTKYCMHASGCTEDYIKAAIEADLDVLGFSDHGPFPDHDYGFRMSYDTLPIYLNEINDLKRNYKDKINILSGFEMEYMPGYDNYFSELLSNSLVDYLVLGEHFYFDSNKRVHNVYNMTKSKSLIDYANSAVEGMKTGFFAYLAHPDLICVNDVSYNKDLETAFNIIIDAAIKYDFILELNANGFRKGKMTYNTGTRYPYPFDLFWQKVSETNIKTIISSDCHAPNLVYDEYVKKAYDYANNLNLNVVTGIQLNHKKESLVNSL